MKQNQTPTKRFIRFPELTELVPLSRSTIWRMEQAGTFPQHIIIGKNSTAWLLSEVEKWIEERASLRTVRQGSEP